MDTFMDKLAQRLTAQEMIRANTAADTEELNQLKGQIGEYHRCLEQMQAVNRELKAVNDQMSRLVNDRIAPEIYKLVEAGVLRLEDAQLNTAGLNGLMEESRAQIQKLSQESVAQIQKLSAEGTHRLENVKVDASGINQLVEESRVQLEQIGEESRRQLQTIGEESSHKLQAIGEESTQKLQTIGEESAQKLQTLSEETGQKLQKISDDSYQKLQELQQESLNLDEIKQSLTEKMEEANDNVHRECVKVYRNVQAIVVEESGKQAEGVNEAVKQLKGKVKVVTGIAIGAVACSAVSLILQILNALHVF